jgi:signal transduction histidine kinase
MSSEMPRRVAWSAAWRISLWGTLAFSIGTLLVFVFLHRFVADDMQHRSDAWLWGAVSLLGDVAERTPKDALYGQVVGEIAELVREEVPNKKRSLSNADDHVFFLQEGEDRSLKLWVGAGPGEDTLKAIQGSRVLPDQPIDLRVDGMGVPFRVVSIRVEDGSRIYLGLSEEDQLRILNNLRFYFVLLWLIIVLFGFALVFSISRSLLKHVQTITDAASRIGRSDLTTRVPTTSRTDEVAHLALTLNNMLDRIENSMHQLHTITDSLAHDIRSPITAVRGRLEASLSARSPEEQTDSIASSIEVLDRLSQFLTDSLDVAEANADALRLARGEVDLEEALVSMIDLYQPSMAENDITLDFHHAGPVKISADVGLIHRMISNLFDNEVTHLPTGCRVMVDLRSEDSAKLILQDDGPGFAPEIIQHLFERNTKGRDSSGHGLGLAFVDAVVRAHGGTVIASNPPAGGARIAISLPLSSGVSGYSREPAMIDRAELSKD